MPFTLKQNNFELTESLAKWVAKSVILSRNKQQWFFPAFCFAFKKIILLLKIKSKRIILQLCECVHFKFGIYIYYWERARDLEQEKERVLKDQY